LALAKRSLVVIFAFLMIPFLLLLEFLRMLDSASA
jgi:hypothetical protein